MAVDLVGMRDMVKVVTMALKSAELLANFGAASKDKTQAESWDQKLVAVVVEHWVLQRAE